MTDLKKESVKKLLESEMAEAIYNVISSNSDSFEYYNGRFTMLLNLLSKMGYQTIQNKAEFDKIVSFNLQEAVEEAIVK